MFHCSSQNCAVSRNSVPSHKVMHVVICFFEFCYISNNWWSNWLDTFSWSKLNIKNQDQDYIRVRDSHFQVLPFLQEKSSKRISQGFGGVHREAGKTPTNFPPAVTQGSESQPQMITNTMDNMRTLRMPNGFLQSDLSLFCCFRGHDLTLSKSIFFFFYIYWSFSSSMDRGPQTYPSCQCAKLN